MPKSPVMKAALLCAGGSTQGLASALGITFTQVQKLLRQEETSRTTEAAIREVFGWGFLDPNLILQVGSVARAEQWVKWVDDLAQEASSMSDAPTESQIVRLPPGCLAQMATEWMRELFLDAHIHAPEGYGASEKRTHPEIEDAMRQDHLPSQILQQWFTNIFAVESLWVSLVSDFNPHPDDETTRLIIRLAGSKMSLDPEQVPAFQEWRAKTRVWLCDALYEMKLELLSRPGPVRIELMDLLVMGIDEMIDRAESESMGLGVKYQLHPDVYMNEILESLRLVHQVLPAILKKLDIQVRINPRRQHQKIWSRSPEK